MSIILTFLMHNVNKKIISVNLMCGVKLLEMIITTKKLSCPSVFFPAFLQTAVIDKLIPALFVGALQSAAIGGL